MSAAVLVRWVARATGPDLVRHLVPRWMVLFLIVVELDVIVDFRRVAALASGLPPLTAGAALALLCAVSAASERRFVGEVLLGPRHTVLRRQPIPGAAWGPAALVVLGPVTAPIGIGALFWYGASAWPAASTWLGLALLPTVLAAARWWGAAALACGIAGGVAAIGQQWPASYLGWAVVVWGATVPLVGVCAASLPTWSGAVVQTPMRPRSVLGALVHRDLLALWRCERWIFGAALSVGLLTAPPVGAMWVNGEYPGRSLTTGALVALAFAGPLALTAATLVARHLGRRFDPSEWPVSAGARALSLALVVAGGTLVPGWAAAAVAAPPIGVAGHLRIAAFVAATGAGAAWWVASRPGRPNPGTWPYWLAACLVPVLVPWGSAGGWLLAAVAFGMASRRLDRRRGRP